VSPVWSESLLNTVVESIPNPIFVKDREGRFVAGNSAFARWFGKGDVKQLLGKTAYDVFPAHLAEASSADDRKVFESGEPVTARHEHRQTDGQLHQLAVTKVPLRDENHYVIGLIGISRDVTAEALAEQDLETERNLFRLIMDAVPDFIFVKDRKGQFITMNRHMLQALGARTPADVAGKTSYDFHEKELATHYHLGDQQVMLTGEPLISHEEIHVDKTGQSRWISTTKMPLRDRLGDIAGLVGISRDITSRKEAESRLEKFTLDLSLERRLLRAVLDNLPDCVYAKDAQGRFLLSNSAHNRMRGATHDEDILGKTDFDLCPEELAKRYQAAEQPVLARGESLLNCLEANTDEKGSRGWLLTTKVPLWDESGHVSGLVGISRDITEQKRAEERLQKSEERLRLALEAGHIGTWIWDAASDSFTADAGLRLMFGLGDGPLERTRSDFNRHTHPDDAQRVEDATRRALEGKEDLNIEYRVVWPNGAIRYVASRGSVLGGAGASGSKMAGVCIDVTARFEAQQKLLATAAELARSNKDLEQFAYIASHDLKAPLRAISSLSEWLEEDVGESLTGESRRYMSLLRSRVKRLEALISDLLKYSRAGRVAGEVTEVETKELVEDVVAMLNPAPGFKVTVAENMPVLQTAKTPLAQIFTNLIGNALKHHDRSDGQIRVGCEDRGEFVSFSVCDDGPGIDARLHYRSDLLYQKVTLED
jgi:PAS domain S-box-containing protein